MLKIIWQTEEIPEEMANLQLETLSLYDNSLKGPVPLFLFNMTYLKVMDLSKNELYGSLPDNICQSLPVIQEMYFGLNQFSGPIPSKFGTCKELGILSLGDNSFSGGVPQSIGNLTKLRELYLGNNKLTEYES
ncbi:LRR domain containing protein [Parasponia andersonii]|uniref:LRR domain containing protein n=1 Tax=Parasponia andersonii TaxID=3476 RepID=A0A2P5C5Y1_PARAD|nr:LRR domain containing protein [Parasponia andersonii]